MGVFSFLFFPQNNFCILLYSAKNNPEVSNKKFIFCGFPFRLTSNLDSAFGFPSQIDNEKVNPKAFFMKPKVAILIEILSLRNEKSSTQNGTYINEGTCYKEDFLE
jgi:hypothetical protein